MSTTITFAEFTNAVNNQANALASAWSTAGEKFLARVIAEGGKRYCQQNGKLNCLLKVLRKNSDHAHCYPPRGQRRLQHRMNLDPEPAYPDRQREPSGAMRIRGET